MKAIPLLLAAVSGAGFLYHNQLQSLLNPARQEAQVHQDTVQQESAPQPTSNRLIPGQFHSTSLDAPAVATNLPENIVSTAGAPVVYSSSYYNNTVVVGQTTRVIPQRQIVVQRQPQVRNTPAPVVRSQPQPRSTPVPAGRSY